LFGPGLKHIGMIKARLAISSSISIKNT